MKTRKLLAAFAAAVMTLPTITAFANENPELEFGLTLVSDGSKVYDTKEIKANEEITFTAKTNEFKKNGDNGYEAATLEFKFDAESELFSGVDDIEKFEFTVVSVKFNGEDVTSADTAYSLSDIKDGGFNINKSIDETKAWMNADDELIAVTDVEVVINVTALDSKKKKVESESEPESSETEPESSETEESSESETSTPDNSGDDKVPHAGGGAGAGIALGGIALAAALIATAKRNR